MSLPLSPEVFRLFAATIEERAGLHYEARDLELFAEKISARAVERDAPSLLDYYYFIRYDPGGDRELDALVETLVVHETYLFRELDQLKVLVERILAPLLAADTRRARVWCAACATGEEPVTLGLLLREAGLLDRVEIVASDISTRALAKAEAGVFRGRALRALDAQPTSSAAALERLADGGVRVRPEIAASIRWLRLNLCDPEAVARLGRFDAILCRNVLIYFSDRTTSDVARCPRWCAPPGRRAPRRRVGVAAPLRHRARVRGAGRGVRLPKAAGMKPIRVLVVDDSAFARKVVRELLEASAEIEVVGIARDGLDALEKIDELAPDVVTLDLVMPNLDGLGVLAAREGKPTPRFVVVSTASEDSDLAVAALAAGAVDVVPKPTSLATDRLYEMSDDLVRKVRIAAEAESPPATFRRSLLPRGPGGHRRAARWSSAPPPAGRRP